MLAILVPATAEERAENDTYAGGLIVKLFVGLDDSDGPIVTTHDLARVLLSCAPDTINYPAAGSPVAERLRRSLGA